jgi:hypothetical protein
MGKEGSVYVAWLNKGKSGEREFAVTFVPDGTIGSAISYRKILGEESLREFLARSLSLGSEHVDAALLDLHEKGSADFDYLEISDDELRRFKSI